MTIETINQIKNNPKYQELVSKRNSFAWRLSAVMLVAYYSFIMLIAFAPQILGMKLGGTVITLGIPLGIFIILLSFVLTGIYVRRANLEFDKLTKEVLDSIKKVA
ncbi:MAG: DUF485 domain-containing protein [Sulfurovaceae bacterium]|nr:DUF485 domain-containing protein [Sulfurovaceae bacterium]